MLKRSSSILIISLFCCGSFEFDEPQVPKPRGFELPSGFQATGVGRKAGAGRKLSRATIAAGGQTNILENPAACPIMVFYGQSSSVGFCDVGGGAPYSCGPLVSTVIPGAHMACWTAGDPEPADGYSGVAALNQDNSVCRRFQAEQPAQNMVMMFDSLANVTQTIFTCWPGNPGHSISELTDDLDTNWPRLENCLDEIRTAVATDPDPMAAFGCDTTEWISLAMIQGESDSGSPGFNNNYTSEVLTFVDKVQTLKDTLEPGTSRDVTITWDQPSNYVAQSDSRAITDRQLLEAASARTSLHVITSKGHAVPNFPCNWTSQAHSFEAGIAPEAGSTLHWSPCFEAWIGQHHGLWQYRLRTNTGPSGGPGMRITSAEMTSSTNLRVCWNVPYPPMVRDTTFCDQGHWAGNDGFNIVHTFDDKYDTAIFPGAPTITNVGSINGNCIDFTTSGLPQAAWGRFEVAYQGEARSATEPEHGCVQHMSGGGAGRGFYTLYHDSDPQTPLDNTQAPYSHTSSVGAPHYNWMLLDSFPISGGQAAPADDSQRYFNTDSGDEWIEFIDETTDVFAGGTAATFSVWIDTNDSLDGDILRKFSTFRWLLDRRTTATRLSMSIGGGVGASFVSTNDVLDFDTTGDVNYILVIDLTQPAGGRGTHYLNCEEIADTENGTMPASFVDTADALQLAGNEIASNGATALTRDWAIWDRALTPLEVARVCQARSDVTAVTEPDPVYFVRPTCADGVEVGSGGNGLTVVENLGTVQRNASIEGSLALVTDGLCP